MVPYIDLKRWQPWGDEVEKAVNSVLKSGQFCLGPEVDEFEKEVAAYCGVEYAVGVNSGTSALHLALVALGIGPGDEVIIPAVTFVATAAAVVYTGATPVLVDIDPGSYTMDPKLLESVITKKTKAIIPVHLYGLPAEMPKIIECARSHGVKVLEDAAQAHGAVYPYGKVGGAGDIAAFSFYPSKNLGACGEAGIITTNNIALAQKARELRDWGQRGKQNHAVLGFNARMSNIQAAVLRVKLPHLDESIEIRRSLAGEYLSLMKGMPSQCKLPWARNSPYKHVWHLFPFQTSNRSYVRHQLARKGIQTGVHYSTPIHKQGWYVEMFPDRKDRHSQSESLASHEVSLPLFPGMTTDELTEVVDVLGKAVRGDY